MTDQTREPKSSATRRTKQRVYRVFAVAAAAVAGWTYGGWIYRNHIEDKFIAPNGAFMAELPAMRLTAAFIRDGENDRAKYVIKHIVRDEEMRTEILRYALSKKNYDVSKFLYEGGAGKNDREIASWMLDLAREKGDTDITSRLVANGLNPDKLLLAACERGDLGGVKRAVLQGANIEKRRLECFRIAIAAGQPDLIRYLIDKYEIGLRYNEDDIIPDALERLAAAPNSPWHLESFKYLLENTTLPYYKREAILGSVFGKACESGNLEAVKIMTENPDIYVDSSLYLARAATSPRPIELMKYMLLHGAQINDQNNRAIAAGVRTWGKRYLPSEDPAAFDYQREYVSFILAQGVKFNPFGELGFNLAQTRDPFNQVNEEMESQIAAHDSTRNSEFTAVRKMLERPALKADPK